MTVPVWLLDIDGVVNAATKEPDPNVWPREAWIRTHAESHGHRWPILVAQPVVDFIVAVHKQGRAEIRWHTTWQDDANALGEAVGLPEFPVQDAPEFHTVYQRGESDRGEGWWKYPAAHRVVVDEHRTLLWTDDDITWSLGRRGSGELRALGSALLVSPNDRTGLCKRHLRQIDEFLTLAGETAA